MKNCKVLCVYKDVNGNQCKVDYELDGKFGTSEISKFKSDCISYEVNKENFRMIPEGVAGKGCNLEFKQFVLWKDLVKNHPRKWIVVEKNNMIMTKGIEDIYCVVVVKILSDDEIEDYMIKCYDNNLPYMSYRTTFLDNFDCGVTC